MRLERLPEYLTTAVAMLVGMGFALYCGTLTGSGQVSILTTILFGCLSLFIILKFRANVWWLIPLAWVLTGKIPILPLPFSLRDLCVMFAFSATCILMALKSIRAKPKYDGLDILMVANVVYVAITFLRNPVGTLAMDSDRVGGKPYFDVFIACLAFWVLSRAFIRKENANGLTVLFAEGPIFQGFLGAITYWFPVLVPVIAPFYTGIAMEAYNATDIRNVNVPGTIDNRQSHLFHIGNTIILALCAFFRPLTLLLPIFWWRFSLVVVAALAVLKSGHRTAVLDAIFVFILASYFRRGIGDVLRITAVGVPALAILIMMQGTFFELPLTAQRALSFFPGKWDPIAVSDAKGSTDWRVEMWKVVLSGSNKYINNKLLGDGFGYSRREYNTMLSTMENRDANASQENAMLQGAFHSGPISAIRFVGVIGLFLFLILLTLMGKRAWKLVRQAEGTSFYPLALFICIPVIIEPFKYVVIFGGYESAFPNTIMNLGMLKMLELSLGASTPPAVGNLRPGAPLKPLNPQIVTTQTHGALPRPRRYAS